MDRNLAQESRAGSVIVEERSSCCLCQTHLDPCLNLPGLPVTGVFSDTRAEVPLQGFDQKLLFCPCCGHGQLLRQIDPSVLYDASLYAFRTSASSTARSGTAFFVDFIRRNFPGRRFQCAIDVGCNDLYLLQQIRDLAQYRVGIDPIWEGKTVPKEDHLSVIGGRMEGLEVGRDLPARPDLVLCRHTIEHIFDPLAVVQKMMDIASEDALFVFETPSFDNLLRRGRFDQVFHEHLQYFSPASFECLLRKCHAHVVGFAENFHDWGAMLIAFRRGKGGELPRFSPVFTKQDIDRKYSLFKDQTAVTRKILREYESSSIYGYGAAMMVPVLAYHLGTDFSFLKAIVDDDPGKDGKFYVNLGVPIMHSARVAGFSDSPVLITAVDNVNPIMVKLLGLRPKHIIFPFHVI